MPSGNYPAFLEVDQLNDPVSYRWEMRGPWGLAAQVMSFDIGFLVQRPETYLELGVHLWSAAIATAISDSWSLDLVWCVRWNQGRLAFPGAPPIGTRGRQSGLPAGKAHCALVKQLTEKVDGYSGRIITLPGTPLAWQSGGQLSSRGWDSMLTWAQGLRMGLAGSDIGGDLTHLIEYTDVAPISVGNLAGVLFRRVSHLSVLEYTDKAPDFQGSLWPD